MAFDLADYVTVPERVAEFYERHPDGRIVSDVPRIVDLDGRVFVEVTTTVFRSPDDPVPCRASAWEPFPGRTPYTKDSEMMNAETSAIGRALAAAGIAVRKSMASANEVANRTFERTAEASRKEPHAVSKKRADILRFLNAVPEKDRAMAKRVFVEKFGDRPADLDPARLDEALTWARSWEPRTSPDSALDSPLTASEPSGGGRAGRKRTGRPSGSAGVLVEVARSSGVSDADLLRAAVDLASARGLDHPATVDDIPADLVDDLTAWMAS